MIKKLVLYKKRIQYPQSKLDKLLDREGRVEYKDPIDGKTIVNKINEIIDILNEKDNYKNKISGIENNLRTISKILFKKKE